jgi:hypothetical protein
VFSTLTYAATSTLSNDVYYDNSNSTLSATTVQEALDELYLKVNPPVDITGEGTLYYQMMSNASLDNTKSTYVSSSSGISFSSISSDTNGKGVYEISSTANDEYPIYYYRGAVTDNNILFAGFCWKIVRTTETGGVKLIYNGSPSNGQCSNRNSNSRIGTSYFNSLQFSNAYVGYMYGTVGSSTYTLEHKNINNSTIKTAIDTWYESNMTSYTDNLEDAVWCNDRSIYSGKGYGEQETVYYAYNRLYNNKTPSLACTNANDRFTVSSDNGNGDLDYPVALLTADEIVYAGAVYLTSNSTFYLCTGEWWWTISPARFGGSAIMWFVGDNGLLNYVSAIYSNGFGVRPAISLKPGTTYSSGTGTSDDPYVVS